jgi:hypothetical protein
MHALDNYENYATNWRESGLTPMTQEEWYALGLLILERAILRLTRRPDDIADLY